LAFVQNQWHIIGNIDWQLNGPLFVSTFFFSENNENKQPQKQQQQVATQVLKVLPEGFRIQHFGAVHDVIIRSEKEKKYSSFMKPKPKMDFSKFLLCPMPGVLISIAVKEGDQVQLGQELAVIEAMKMQNVLRAEKKGIIKKINHQPGDSLKVDELILEYE
jgi:propionyl-CoA carboxylase alpha chain